MRGHVRDATMPALAGRHSHARARPSYDSRPAPRLRRLQPRPSGRIAHAGTESHLIAHARAESHLFPEKLARPAYSWPEALFLGRIGLAPLYCPVYGPMRIRPSCRGISASIGRGLSPIHAGGDGQDAPKNGQIIPFGIIPADDGERNIPSHPKIYRSVCRPPGRGDPAISRVPPYKGRDLEVSPNWRRWHSHASVRVSDNSNPLKTMELSAFARFACPGDGLSRGWCPQTRGCT